MAAPKLIIEEGGPYQFNFNDDVNARLQLGFEIPKADYNEQGQRKRERGMTLGLGDYNKLTIPIPFKLLGNAKDALLLKQRTLIKALNRSRNVLTWNPDPDTCSDVYFATYPSPLDMALDKGFYATNRGLIKVELLADAQPYPAEATVFDQVVGLAQMDGETGEWSGNSFSVDTTRYRAGSKSARTAAATLANSWLIRNAVTALNLTPFLTTGWVTAALQLDTVPETMDKFIVRIGNDVLNYRQYDLTASFGNTGFVVDWQLLFFNLNAPTAVVGTPSMTAANYFVFEADMASGSGPAFNVDNVHVVNGKACNVRGQTPLPITIYDIGGEYECGFKADIRASQKVDLAVGDGETGEWSANSVSAVAVVPPGTQYNIQPLSGSKMIEVKYIADTAGGAVRNPAGSGLDCSSLSTGSISFAINPWPHPDFGLEIRIGNSSVNYVKKNYSFVALAFGGQWRTFSFDVSSMAVGVGTVNWANPIDYVEFYITTGSPQTFNLYIDETFVCEPGGSIDELWLTKGGEEALAACPGVISLPESSPPAPAGGSWEVTPTPTNLAGAFGGSYYSWTIGTTEKRVFPTKLLANLYAGEYRLLARIRTNDANGGSVRFYGYDEHSGEWSLGDTVPVGYNGGNWQTIEIEEVGLPFDGFHRDADLTKTFMILGLGITSAQAAKTWDVNVIAVPNVDGGARHFSPAVGRRYNCFDSRYHDSPGYSQSASADSTAHSVARQKAIGDLLALDLDINNLLIQAGDSTSPNIVASAFITKLTYVPRLKNGKD